MRAVIRLNQIRLRVATVFLEKLIPENWENLHCVCYNGVIPIYLLILIRLDVILIINSIFTRLREVYVYGMYEGEVSM